MLQLINDNIRNVVKGILCDVKYMFGVRIVLRPDHVCMLIFCIYNLLLLYFFIPLFYFVYVLFFIIMSDFIFKHHFLYSIFMGLCA